jgi:hypothetical protein
MISITNEILMLLLMCLVAQSGLSHVDMPPELNSGPEVRAHGSRSLAPEQANSSGASVHLTMKFGSSSFPTPESSNAYLPTTAIDTQYKYITLFFSVLSNSFLLSLVASRHAPCGGGGLSYTSFISKYLSSLTFYTNFNRSSY